MEIAAIKDLTFTYSGSDAPALKNISLSVGRGELVLLCGASGSGKSTLLRHFRSVLTPKGTSSGEVVFNGSPLSGSDQRTQSEKIAFVGQDPEAMIVTDKVWHELAFSLESLGEDKDTIRRRTAEMAEFFGLSEQFMRDTSELSGGKKQLLALAAAMTTRPDLLILDEPTSQLDPIAAKELFDAVLRINRELGTTVIVSEHRIEDIFPLADRLVLMSGGEIICDCQPAGLPTLINDPYILLSLPVPARVWLSAGADGNCPGNVAQGREWLASRLTPDQTYAAPLRQTPLSDETVIDVKGLCFRYKKPLPDVLKGLDLQVRKGEFLCLLGGNGSGKSTLLSVLAGIRKPYSGKVKITGRTLMMPQDPSSLFCRDTLLQDLREICSDHQQLTSVISLCRLDGLTARHPFDLSGGEMQRAALAKLLLASPDILLLDEPTKGTDAAFKHELSCILKELCVRGKTVIMVSHDVEFAASYCTRCAMLFGGELIGSAAPQEFFSGNMFYTTSAARMSRGLIENAVTAEDILSALGIEPPALTKSTPPDIPTSVPEPPPTKKKATPPRLLCRVLSLAMTGFSAIGCMELLPGVFGEQKLLPYILLALSVILAAVSFSDGKQVSRSRRERRPVSPRSAVSAAVILLLIPFTVYAGAHFLNTGKYLFVSLLVMLEASLPFYLLFEGRHPGAREVVTVAVLTAAAVSGRLAFYMLPQFKPVLAVVVISGAAFGSQTGFLVGSLSMLLSNFMFGQGPWTPWQMFSMGMIGMLSGLFFGRGILPLRREVIALFGFFSAVIVYGGIVNPSTLFIMHNELPRESLTAAYAAGLPLDIIHGAASLGFLYALAPSVLKKLERLRVKYGFFE
ncbi:MAG: ATP-binding cassette domain-containing protein [Ruminococcus sp.]|nr:ATP-binding cassette domain-containing protein [Ruminococcus sp.]